MITATFDTHFYVKRLTETGHSEAQAEAIVDVVSDTRQLDLVQLATKSELFATKSELKSEIRELRTELKGDMHALEFRMDARFKDLQLKLGGMIVALGALLIAIKYFG